MRKPIRRIEDSATRREKDSVGGESERARRNNSRKPAPTDHARERELSRVGRVFPCRVEYVGGAGDSVGNESARTRRNAIRGIGVYVTREKLQAFAATCAHARPEGFLSEPIAWRRSRGEREDDSEVRGKQTCDIRGERRACKSRDCPESFGVAILGMARASDY